MKTSFANWIVLSYVCVCVCVHSLYAVYDKCFVECLLCLQYGWLVISHIVLARFYFFNDFPTTRIVFLDVLLYSQAVREQQFFFCYYIHFVNFTFLDTLLARVQWKGTLNILRQM